jgi:hypothetical protein
MLGMAPFLAADLVFFLAQRDARPGQFPPFEWLPSLIRMARYSAANLFGGLPLYVGTEWQAVVSAVLAGLLAAALLLIAARWRHVGTETPRRLLLAGAVAPPLGLLALGVLFNNTPIELRYLAFATPFVALLLAGAIGTMKRATRHAVTATLIGLQTVSLVGLMTRPETMQPARAAALHIGSLADRPVVLLPRGNDGVGIVGAFAIEVPPATPILLLRGEESVQRIRQRIAGLKLIAFAALAQDAASREAIDTAREALSDRCWHLLATSGTVTLHERVCD